MPVARYFLFVGGVLLALLFAVPTFVWAASPDAAATTAMWDAPLAAFAAADDKHAPPPGGVRFVGSSSIRLWNGLESDFAALPWVINRGFGGGGPAACVH